jgi:hypothetical protein
MEVLEVVGRDVSDLHRDARRRRDARPVVPLPLAVRLLLGAVLLSGCAAPGGAGPSAAPTAPPDDPTDGVLVEVGEPCPDGDGTALDLGDPYRGQEAAEFDTDGGRVWVTARAFPSGGMFDPDVGRTRISVGPASTAPVYDEQAGRVLGPEAEVDVVEATWSALDLPAGRWWLWSSTGGDVRVRSCTDGGVADAVPARAAPPVS